ncbi:LacI family transcriptional regulator [Oenococcus oeni]|uniref:LacI family transcriptional regulator n=1 Tax=Oenococcus oeni TaxID=1247 RepID=UPI003EE7A7AE
MSINDVAKAAGVSRGTVSNYLNHRPVSDELAAKIKKAIKDLNYVPNSAARDLRSQDSQFVVFIIPTVWESFFSELTYYIQRTLIAHHFKMILCISNSDFDQEKDYLELADSQKAAGIISISYSQINQHVSPSMPLVSIEKEPTGSFPLVSSDNYQGGELAGQSLHQLGCENLVYMGGRTMSSDAMVARLSGFSDYCASKHLTFDHFGLSSYRKPVVVTEEVTRILQDLQTAGKLANAGIFASTDEYALMIYKVLLRLHIQVPQQVQLVGFNGSKVSMQDTPTLSSIRQPVELIAETVVKELEKKIRQNKQQEEATAPARIYLPVSFQQGETTAVLSDATAES